MNHKSILLAFFCFVIFALFIYIIKNKPDYLVLLGIRSLFSYVLIQLINYLCTAAQLSVLLLANPLTLFLGGLLGFPGILLLYFTSLYFH